MRFKVQITNRTQDMQAQRSFRHHQNWGNQAPKGSGGDDVALLRQVGSSSAIPPSDRTMRQTETISRA